MNSRIFLGLIAACLMAGCAQDDAPPELPPESGDTATLEPPTGIAETSSPRLQDPPPAAMPMAPGDPPPANRLPTTITRERAGQVSQGLGGGTDID